jgi:hypothetical protein
MIFAVGSSWPAPTNCLFGIPLDGVDCDKWQMSSSARRIAATIEAEIASVG